MHDLSALPGALRGGVEAAHAFNLLAEQLDARGERICGRPDIDDAAPPTALTRCGNHRSLCVARLCPDSEKFLQAHVLAGAQRTAVSTERLLRQRVRHQGAGTTYGCGPRSGRALRE